MKLSYKKNIGIATISLRGTTHNDFYTASSKVKLVITSTHRVRRWVIQSAFWWRVLQLDWVKPQVDTGHCGIVAAGQSARLLYPTMLPQSVFYRCTLMGHKLLYLNRIHTVLYRLPRHYSCSPVLSLRSVVSDSSFQSLLVFRNWLINPSLSEFVL